MSCLASTDCFVAVAKGLYIDLFDESLHNIIEVPSTTSSLPDSDHISDIVVSYDFKHLAVMTSTSKRLIIYTMPMMKIVNTFILPRSASKARFSVDNKHVLIADKSGDVLLYVLGETADSKKLLGHLSLLLDVLQTPDKKYIITTDRDEKIRVSCYPNTYNIETYCLGHKEYVNHIEILPHNLKFLTSTSGDGTVKVWDYINGKVCYSIDTHKDVNNNELKDNFIQLMDNEGVEVSTLPIVHFAITKVNESCSVLAVTIHSINSLFIYTLCTVNDEFNHKLKIVALDFFPAALQFNNSFLFIYNNVDSTVMKYNLLTVNENVELRLINKTIMFENITNGIKDIDIDNFDSIKVLYKRKFDNVQEYQERKKQRLEKILLQ